MATATNPETGERVYLDEATNTWMPARTATNPETGEKIFFDGKGWQPLSPQAASPTYQSPAADQAPRDAPPPTNVPIVAQSTGAGLANLAGALPNAASALANLPLAGVDLAARQFGDYQPTGGFRFGYPGEIAKNRAAQLAESAGYHVRSEDEMTWPQQLAYNINKTGVEAAGFVPLMARVGATRAIDFAKDRIPKWYDKLVGPYAGEQTARTLAADATAAAGAGGGVTLANQFDYTKDSPLAQFGASMGGSLSGNLLAAMALQAPRMVQSGLRSVTGLTDDITVPPDPTKSLAEQPRFHYNAADKAAEIVQGAAGDPNRALARLDENLGTIAPYMSATPTVAQMTETPSLLRLQQGVQYLPQNRARFDEALAKLQGAAVDTTERLVPPGAQRSDFLNVAQNEKNARLGEALTGVTQAERNVQRVETARQNVAEPVAAQAGVAVPASQNLQRQAVEQSLRPMTEARGARYEAIPDAPVSARPLIDEATALDTELARLPQGFRQQVDPGGVLTGLRNLVDEEGNARYVGLQTLQRMRNQLGESQQNARKAGEFQLADNFGQLRQRIAQMVDEHPEAAEATRFTREEFSPVWGRESPTAREFRKKFWRDPDTQSTVPPSEFAPKFIQPNAPETTAELQRIIGSMPNPQAAQAEARRFLLADLANSGAISADGTLQPRQVERWTRNNQANLDLAPGFRQEIEGVLDRARRGVEMSERVTGDLRGARKAYTTTEAQIADSAIGRVLGADPERAFHTIMSDPNRSGGRFKELIALAKREGPQAEAGLKKMFGDYLVDKVSTTATNKMPAGDRRGPISWAQLNDVWQRHQDDIAELHGPENTNAMRAVHRAVELAQDIPKGPGSSDTLANVGQNIVDKYRGTGIGAAIETMTRFQMGHLAGGSAVATARRALHGVGKEQARQIEELVTRSMLDDPKLAKFLLGRELRPGSPAWNKTMAKYLAGSAALREYGDEDE